MFSAQALEGVPAGGAETLSPMNAFVKIGADDTVTVLSKHIEMGQGPFTGLATIVAEELDADWSQMRAVHSPADDKVYANLAFGLQGTGGSTSIANSYEQLRKAGATARAMLVAAAAAEWGVPASEITVSKGRIKHAASGKESGFGALADKAATQTPPAEPTLKDPKDFVLIGQELPKLDTLSKTNGTAVFTLDITGRQHARCRRRAPRRISVRRSNPSTTARRARCRASSTSNRCRRASRFTPTTPLRH